MNSATVYLGAMSNPLSAVIIWLILTADEPDLLDGIVHALMQIGGS